MNGASDSIQLVAVQMRLSVENYWSRDAFEAAIDGLMGKVAERIAPDVPTLVTFPEDVGLMLVAQGMEGALGSAGSIEEAISKGVRANLPAAGWKRIRYGFSWVPALFLARHELIASTYFDVFSRAASRYGRYLVAGSVVLPPYRIEDVREGRYRPIEGRVYNTSYLFAPDGTIVGAQTKTHLIPLETEEALDLTAGRVEALRVFETPLGKIGIAICLDAFQDEVVAQLRAQEAEILVMPSANPGAWSEWQQIDWLQGAHRAVIETAAFPYAVNTMLTGPLFDLGFYGQSSILSRRTGNPSPIGYAAIGPMEGFLQVAHTCDAEEILVARVPHP